MPLSLIGDEVKNVLGQARSNALQKKTKEVTVGDKKMVIPIPYGSPTDWRDQVIYFLMVDRFNKPNDTRSPLPFEQNTSSCLGGTIKGITAQLDYIRELGATALWLSPVLRNTLDSIHGYSIQNFLMVDPRFGDDSDLVELVDQAHARDMYVILDIVLNHAGDVFEYDGYGHKAPNVADDKRQYPITWHKADGAPKPAWKIAPQDIAPTDPDLTPGAAIFPDELRNNEWFRRRGVSGENEKHGDFESLKEFITEYLSIENNRVYYPVRDILIKIHQYLIAKFDLDGFRIDTIKHVERDCELVFGNAIREFACTIGKANFFTFGEAKSGDEKTLIAYTGRYASEEGDMMGLDSTLDFPLMWDLQSVCKGFGPPSELARLYEYRKRLIRGEGNEDKVLLSSHGEAGKFYVTKIDNHDERKRFRYCPIGSNINAPYPYDNQVTLALVCLAALWGIPCIYYGTEQGLRGAAPDDASGADWYVREALWGKPGKPFDRTNRFYVELKKILAVRAATPALRYGRQYFRPISGNNCDFGISPHTPGIISFSRILHDTEIVVVANTNTGGGEEPVSVVVDYDLNPIGGKKYSIVYSNYGNNATPPDALQENGANPVRVYDTPDGAASNGPIHYLRVHLKPMEVQILA